MRLSWGLPLWRGRYYDKGVIITTKGVFITTTVAIMAGGVITTRELPLRQGVVITTRGRHYDEGLPLWQGTSLRRGGCHYGKRHTILLLQLLLHWILLFCELLLNKTGRFIAVWYTLIITVWCALIYRCLVRADLSLSGTRWLSLRAELSLSGARWFIAVWYALIYRCLVRVDLSLSGARNYPDWYG